MSRVNLRCRDCGDYITQDNSHTNYGNSTMVLDMEIREYIEQSHKFIRTCDDCLQNRGYADSGELKLYE